MPKPERFAAEIAKPCVCLEMSRSGGEVEVTIVRSGDVLTIYPARKPIGDLVKELAQLPRPPSIEGRDDDVLPERPGL